MVGSLSSVPLPVPVPRRPPGPGEGAVRHWYENELGWPTVPGSPVRLVVGHRFDVLDLPVEAGRGALRRLGPGSPVAVRADRMQLLVAAGGAEEVPGLLEWLEWGAVDLDLVALGAGALMDAPAPPGGVTTSGAGTASSTGTVRVPGARRATDAGSGPGSGEGPRPGGRSCRGPGCDLGCGLGCGLGAGPCPGAGRRDGTGPRPGADPAGAWAPARERRGSQGAAVWLRPPEPGREVEASLPGLSAVGGRAGVPDLVRLVDTAAAECHRIRLRRACAQPVALSR
ncbi:SCO3374 family protein [Streptomyces sp. NPDC004065]|uniref:SCO3374 family protein n=1 Tax=Streptomyces sp. NPDC004065 TaxID=3364689 RepID=UPI003850AC89